MKQQDVKTNAEYIKRMMKRFKLVDMREQYQDLILEAESSSMDYETFLVRLLAAEEEGKIRRRTEKLRREASFEFEKRLDDHLNHSTGISRNRGHSMGKIIIGEEAFPEIIGQYNFGGKTAAYDCLRSRYGIKHPYFVMKRIKDCGRYT